MGGPKKEIILFETVSIVLTVQQLIPRLCKKQTNSRGSVEVSCHIQNQTAYASLKQIAVNSRQLLRHKCVAGIHTCKAMFQTANCYRRCEYGQTKRNRVQSILPENNKKKRR
jgi:hypothetical protein